MKDNFFTFSKGKISYGIETVYVSKLIGLHEITEITGLHNNVKGIINFRGRIIPVIDTQIILNKESKAYTDTTCILIIEIQKIFVGIIIDTPDKVLDMDIVINVLVMMNLIKLQN